MTGRTAGPLGPVLRLLCLLYAFSGLAVVLGLAACVLLGGWQTVVVDGDSMEPALRTGDIVVVDPDPQGPVRVDDLLTFRDRSRGGALVTHRVEQLLADGYRTRGDANPTADTTSVHRQDVVGVGRLLVPYAGTPLVWARAGDVLLLGIWGAATVAAVGVAWQEPGQRRAPDGRRPPGDGRGRRLLRPGAWPTSAAVTALLLPVTGLPEAVRVTGAAFSASTSSVASWTAGSWATATVVVGHLGTAAGGYASGDTASSADLALAAAAPTAATLHNYDTERDSAPGLLLSKASGIAETDATKRQTWLLDPAADVVLDGTPTVRLWTAPGAGAGSVGTGGTGGTLELLARLELCDGGGTGCALVADGAFSGAWTDDPTFTARDVVFAAVTAVTVPDAGTLRLTLVNGPGSSEKLAVGYGTTAHPARLELR